MTQTVEGKNKALVLEAFETLFNKKDYAAAERFWSPSYIHYAAAERFWSPSYIQHSKHVPPGRDGLFGLVKAAPETSGRHSEAERGPPQPGRHRAWRLRRDAP